MATWARAMREGYKSYGKAHIVDENVAAHHGSRRALCSRAPRLVEWDMSHDRLATAEAKGQLCARCQKLNDGKL